MSNDVWQRIEEARERWNVLEHPFYQRWSAGELSREELARYSGQYRHATAAIARLSADVAESAPEAERAELRRHAEEEEAHIALWDGFVEAVGGEVAAEPTRGDAGVRRRLDRRATTGSPSWSASTRSRAASRRSRRPSARASPPTTGSATAPATSTSASTRRPTSSTPPRVAR